MIDFGKLLRRYRKDKSLSQNEFVNFITKNDNKLAGLDVVTISRWENNVVIPIHRRQIEVFAAANYSFWEVVLKNKDLLANGFKSKVLKKAYAWENSEHIELSDVRYKVIRSKDAFGNILYCLLYTNEKGIPIGQITYRYLSKNDFWKSVDKPSEKWIFESDSELCLEISSMFCFTDKILPHMLGHIVNQLFIGKVAIIGFCCKNKKSSLKRFLKSIGFQMHREQENSTSLVLTYYDALYNKELFYSSIMIGIRSNVHVQKM